MSLVLLAQAGWLLRSFIRMSNVELGFSTSGIYEIPLAVPQPAQANRDAVGAPAAEWHRRLEAIRQSLARTRRVQSRSGQSRRPIGR